MALIAAGCGAARQSGSVTTSASTDLPTLQSEPVTTAASTAPPTLDESCRSIATPATWDQNGTIHTIVPGQLPVAIAIEAEPRVVCPGGTTRVRVEIRNTSGTAIEFGPQFLILNGGMNNWELDTVGPAHIAALDHAAFSFTVTLPLVTPDRPYSIQVYGYGPGLSLQVTRPNNTSTT